MRFKVDENLPQESAELLNQAGHDAVTVIAQGMSGKPDTTLAAVCVSEERALITLDLDFADIRTYPPVKHWGFVVLRPAVQAKPHVLKLLRQVIQCLSSEKLAGKLWWSTKHASEYR